MEKQNILIVDDDSCYRDFLADGLTVVNYDVISVCIMEEAVDFIENKELSILLMALNNRSRDSLDMLKRLKQEFPFLEIIVLAQQPDMKTAFNALRLGAFDFLAKSPNIEELIPVIDAACKKSKKAIKKKKTVKHACTSNFDNLIVGETPQTRSIVELIQKVASADSTVLVLGETGVGKELVAQTIYRNSIRVGGPFVALNCGAIPDTLLESEIFGHERGAFTDAFSSRAGLLEEAKDGTIFFDEVSEMSLPVQAKLLRAIETGRFRRLGSNKEIQANARIIAATNKDLISEVKEKRFRADLYYRLAVVTINIPSLKERNRDIPVLAEYFLRELSRRIFPVNSKEDGAGRVRKISASAMKFLMEYEWPGNIRELKNVIERLIILSEGQTITPYDIAQAIPGLYSCGNISGKFGKNEIPSLEELEKTHIANVLNLTGGRRGRAAQILGISSRTLYTKLNQYRINVNKTVE